jgi:hypothetical protein
MKARRWERTTKFGRVKWREYRYTGVPLAITTQMNGVFETRSHIDPNWHATVLRSWDTIESNMAFGPMPYKEVPISTMTGGQGVGGGGRVQIIEWNTNKGEGPWQKNEHGDQVPTEDRHACTCDFTALLRDGCKCGGR